MGRWRGWKALAHDAVDATTHLVREGHESGHRATRRVTDRLGPAAEAARLASEGALLGTEATLWTVRAVNRAVEVLTDAALDASLPADPGPDGPPVPMRSDIVGTTEWIADAAVGAVGGAVGSHLAARHNRLDLGMVLRRGDRYLRAGEPVGPLSDLVVVWVHGLGTTEWCWCLDADVLLGSPTANFGTLLEADLGATSLFARYNTGRPVADNGAHLAAELERVLADHSGRVALVGHSMGGLVSRGACAAAAGAGHRWLERLDWVITLGTPHQGAPLARLGASVTSGLAAVDLPATRVLAGILAGRSAGIRDLEEGEPGFDPDATAEPADRHVPLLDGVRYAFLRGTVTADPEHPVGRFAGDLLVRVGSAAGPVQPRPFTVSTEPFGGVPHHRLMVHPAVYAEVRRLLSGA